MKKSLTKQLADAQVRIKSLEEVLETSEDRRKALMAENNSIREHIAKLPELEKKLSDATKSKDSNYESWRAVNRELEQLHAFFDAIPTAPTRKIEDTYHDRSVLTRLAAWLATK